MATVVKRRGKWTLDYRDQHGKRHWQATDLTKREANDLLTQKLQEIGRGDYQAPRQEKTFDELIKAFTTATLSVNLRDTTRKDYEGRLNLHLSGAAEFSGIKLRAITPQMVERFRSRLLDQLAQNAAGKTRKIEAELKAAQENQAKPPKPDTVLELERRLEKARILTAIAGRRTVNKCLILLGSMFRYAVDNDWMVKNPAARVAKLKDNAGTGNEPIEDNILRPDEIKKLLEAFEVSDSQEGRFRVIIKTAILTGLRQGELLGLRWGDIDRNRKQIHVRRQYVSGRFSDLKTKHSRRSVDFPENLLIELDEWRIKCPHGPHDLVFPNGAGNPENHGNLLRRGFYPGLRRAGIKQVRFHDLRHTFASLLIATDQHPKYIQSQLGHSSIKITMDTYGHLMNPTNNQAAEKLAALALGGSKKSESGSKVVASGVIGRGRYSQPIEVLVPRGRIELPTQGFSGLCSTD